MTKFAGPGLIAALLEGLPLTPTLGGSGEARTEVTCAPSKHPAPARKRPPGRPSTLTPALTRSVCKGLRTGLTIGRACRLAGLPQRTFHAWLSKGEDDREDDLETPQADFARAVRLARAELADELLRALLRGGPGWKVPARLLERLFPEDYALGATRLRAQRLAARREVARGIRRGRPLEAHDLTMRFDVLGPDDCARLAAAR